LAVLRGGLHNLPFTVRLAACCAVGLLTLAANVNGLLIFAAVTVSGLVRIAWFYTAVIAALVILNNPN